MTTRYKNAFHEGGCGPEYYETDARPVEHGGYLLFNRIPGTVCDIVRDGVCVGQYVTVRAAKRRINEWGEKRAKGARS
jgi:hypothetical protein